MIVLIRNIVICIMLLSVSLKAQTTNPKLALAPLWGFDHLIQDSIMIDTNSLSFTYLEYYVKNRIYIGFNEYVFINVPMPMDTAFSWDAIDTSYSKVRSQFEMLEQDFGYFYFLRYELSDTSEIYNAGFEMYFQKYFHLETGLNAMRIIDTVLYVVVELPVPVSAQIGNLKSNIKLFDCYPNPTSESISFSYYLSKPSKVIIRCHNSLGEEVALIVDEYQDIGKYLLTIDFSDLSQGIYFYQLLTDYGIKTKQFMIVK